MRVATSTDGNTVHLKYFDGAFMLVAIHNSLTKLHKVVGQSTPQIIEFKEKKNEDEDEEHMHMKQVNNHQAIYKAKYTFII